MTLDELKTVKVGDKLYVPKNYWGTADEYLVVTEIDVPGKHLAGTYGDSGKGGMVSWFNEALDPEHPWTKGTKVTFSIGDRVTDSEGTIGVVEDVNTFVWVHYPEADQYAAYLLTGACRPKFDDCTGPITRCPRNPSTR